VNSSFKGNLVKAYNYHARVNTIFFGTPALQVGAEQAEDGARQQENRKRRGI
jgi:hypothetical protein